MSKAAQPVPEGYHTVTPHLVIRGAAEALDFYGKAFGAEEMYRMPMPDGKVAHAEMKIGDSTVMMSDEFPEMGARSPASLGGCPGGLMIYCADVDAAFQRAVDAGCTVKMPPTDMFWGDRYCKVEDPYGHLWAIATHTEDLTPEEIAERAKQHMQG